MHEFAQRLKQARIDAGYASAKEFAEALGVEPPAYRYWERGQSQPDLVTLTRICRLLSVDANYFLPLSIRTKTTGNDASAA